MTYDFDFADGSRLSVPEPWRAVWERSFQHADLTALEARLRFVTRKFVAQRAMPSKYDGVFGPAGDDTKFDDPGYYFEHWKEQEPAPTMAQVAKQVVYQSLRLGLMQQTLNEWAKEDGRTPPEVISPQEFLRRYGDAEPLAPDEMGDGQ